MAFRPIHVGEIELSRPLAPLAVDERYAASRPLVRLHGAPLGFATVELEGGRATPEAQRDTITAALGDVIREHLEADGLEPRPLDVAGLEDPADPPCARPGPYGDPDEPVTVVVCTHNPPPSLRPTLETLLANEPAAAEIVLVDNGSQTDTAQRVVDELASPRIRLVEEPIAGLSRARNRGLSVARHDLVAFTDDDVRTDLGWVGAMRRGFTRAPRVGCVTGLLPSAELETPAQLYLDARAYWSSNFAPTVFDLHDHRGDDPFFPYSAGHFGTGANFALRRSALSDIGAFDEALGVGSLAEGAEDLDFFLRVLLAGWALAYETTAIGWHGSRRDPDAVRYTMRTYGVGVAAYAFKHARRPRVAADLARIVPAALITLARRGRDAEALAGHMDGIAAAELRGLLAGPLYYLRARRALRDREPIAGAVP